ncbi:MarR family winged helix-turn-helix transcriptional regulator [Veronia pacifica]|uniref:MarR family transcriptional regulator n=1 Tax=Veronia pacifica TaxID=1080227 RepID=A0A1C3E9H6_9GAMM|nr:MarR family transcriptional regulator [Veronia pacifica]ODA29928.1 MarR family transcriptional regulator [Veronia pacifica]
MKQDHVDLVLSQWHEQKPELDTSPIAVIGRLSRVANLMTPQVNDLFKRHDISSIEFDILASLRRSGKPVTPTELYQTLMLSSGAMSTRLEGLVKRGLVERQASETDRRSCKVTLTDKGSTEIDHLFSLHIENEKRILSPLNKEEQAQLAGLLKKWLLSNE